MQKVILFMFALGLVCAEGLADQTFNEFRLNTVTASWQKDQAVDSDGQGEFIVLWESKYSEEDPWYEVAAQRYNQYGIQIGEEFTVNQRTERAQAAPAVVMKPDGGFIAAWESYFPSGTGYDIIARVFDANDMPLCDEFCVNQLRTSNQWEADVVLNANGDFMVVWKSYHNVYDPVRYWELRGRIYNADGLPLTADFSITTDCNSAREPKVVANGAGGFIVVSTNQAFEIYAHEYSSAGVLIGSPHFIGDTHGVNHKVYFDSVNRHLTVLYGAKTTDATLNVFAKKFDQTFNEVVPLTLINEMSTCDCLPGAIEQLSNGDYLFSWTRRNRDDRHDDFMVRRFSSGFVPLEGEQQVNSVPSLFPYPDMANECFVNAVDPNRYAVVWATAPFNNQDTDIMAAIGPKTWLGDFDHDGAVNAGDLSMMSDYWLDDEPVFDLNPVYGDGAVNLNDFSTFAQMWLVGM